ncbi:unnamed protein product [Ectocarpus fasciculatus]
MQGKPVVLHVAKKPPTSYGVDVHDRPDMDVVLDLSLNLCKGQAGHDRRGGEGEAGDTTGPR